MLNFINLITWIINILFMKYHMFFYKFMRSSHRKLINSEDINVKLKLSPANGRIIYTDSRRETNNYDVCDF